MSATRVFSLSIVVCACDCDWGWYCDAGVKDGDIRSSRVEIDDVLTTQREDRRRKVAIVDAAAGRWSSIRLLNSFCYSYELRFGSDRGQPTVDLTSILKSVCKSMHVLSSLYIRLSLCFANALRSSAALLGSG